jgi:hypothetical protein
MHYWLFLSCLIKELPIWPINFCPIKANLFCSSVAVVGPTKILTNSTKDQVDKTAIHENKKVRYLTPAKFIVILQNGTVQNQVELKCVPLNIMFFL